jgi:hypothetical protein
VRRNYIREEVENKESKLVHTSSEDMITDVGTKPLNVKVLKIFMSALVCVKSAHNTEAVYHETCTYDKTISITYQIHIADKRNIFPPEISTTQLYPPLSLIRSRTSVQGAIFPFAAESIVKMSALSLLFMLAYASTLFSPCSAVPWSIFT